MKFPAVVVSRDGHRGVLIQAHVGNGRLRNRDALGVQFEGRQLGQEDAFAFGVAFSGTVAALSLESLGLPPGGLRDENLMSMALAALGDHLDEAEIGEARVDGAQIPMVPCFSQRIEEWRNRRPTSDEEVERYINVHLLRAWQSELRSWWTDRHDLIRLAVSVEARDRILDLYDESRWITEGKGEGLGVAVKPSREFIREFRERDTALTGGRTKQGRHGLVSYVAEDRIRALRQMSYACGFDVCKLIRLLEELNSVAEVGAYHAVAALVRAIIDHVPPVFSQPTFSAVASSYGGTRSFKENMAHLDSAARMVADAHLHTQIRQRESLPTPQQVDFRSQMDVLVGEVIRVLERRHTDAESRGEGS